MRQRSSWLGGFTLIELLTVIFIISILAGLTFAAAEAVMKSASRSRSRTEIAGISQALEAYKSDNGTYPASAGFSGSNYPTLAPSPVGPTYQDSSAQLYQALTGQTNFGDPAPTWGTKIYSTFTPSQLGNYSTGGGNVYIRDPFGNSYGYYDGFTTSGPNADTPINGTNQFDLWSTGGDTTGATNSWISNFGNGS